LHNGQSGKTNENRAETRNKQPYFHSIENFGIPSTEN
jgi:hypothetical protein